MLATSMSSFAPKGRCHLALDTDTSEPPSVFQSSPYHFPAICGNEIFILNCPCFTTLFPGLLRPCLSYLGCLNCLLPGFFLLSPFFPWGPHLCLHLPISCHGLLMTSTTIVHPSLTSLLSSTPKLLVASHRSTGHSKIKVISSHHLHTLHCLNLPLGASGPQAQKIRSTLEQPFSLPLSNGHWAFRIYTSIHSHSHCLIQGLNHLLLLRLLFLTSHWIQLPYHLQFNLRYKPPEIL